MNGGYIMLDIDIGRAQLPAVVPGAFDRLKEALRSKKTPVMASGEDSISPQSVVISTLSNGKLRVVTAGLYIEVDANDLVTATTP